MKDLLFFIPAIVLIALGFGVPRIVKATSITCSSQNGGCSDYVVEKIFKAKGMSVYDAKAYLNKVFLKETRVTAYTAKFKVPNKLMVWVVERKPIAAISTGGANYSLIDKEGVVLGTSSETKLPIIVAEGRSKVDEPLVFSSNIMYYLNLLYQTKLAHLKEDGSLEVDNIRGMKVVFPSEGDRDILLGSLKITLSGLQGSLADSRIKIIDLRFKNPVLKPN
ncbi:MAG TPA: hypothetical protein VF185_03090 [Patescibacteria group bacterium]